MSSHDERFADGSGEEACDAMLTVRLPATLLAEIEQYYDDQVAAGEYPNRSAGIRADLKAIIQQEDES